MPLRIVIAVTVMVLSASGGGGVAQAVVVHPTCLQVAGYWIACV
jgi:hypothetical protein